MSNNNKYPTNDHNKFKKIRKKIRVWEKNKKKKTNKCTFYILKQKKKENK